MLVGVGVREHARSFPHNMAVWELREARDSRMGSGEAGMVSAECLSISVLGGVEVINVNPKRTP